VFAGKPPVVVVGVVPAIVEIAPPSLLNSYCDAFGTVVQFQTSDEAVRVETLSVGVWTIWAHRFVNVDQVAEFAVPSRLA
jgi:hypothetical protein